MKHQRLINKLNSTGTFRRELQASFFETPFQEIRPKIIQKQGFGVRSGVICKSSPSLIGKKLTKDLVLAFDTASPSMVSLGAITALNLILEPARCRVFA